MVVNHLGADVSDINLRVLKLGLSPRLSEQDIEHAQLLAYRFDECPPILVERSTSTVIDGVHRLLAARMLGRKSVTVQFFDGTHEQAFVEAVKSNIAHGKPLSLTEREAAAKKILQMTGDWSDRRVAEVCGLSDKTVGRLRKSSADIPQSMKRVGRDGRVRPVDPKQLRDSISSVLTENPDTRPQDLARSLATSATTVRNVRKQLRSGGAAADQSAESSGTNTVHHSSQQATSLWATDSAILSMGDGVNFGGWLDKSKIASHDWVDRVAEVPLGRIPQLIEDARDRADQWAKFASLLEVRYRHSSRLVD
jgi:hypothetical protein